MRLHLTRLPARRFLIALATAGVLAGGCATAPAPAPAAAVARPADAGDAVPAGPQTVTEALGDLPEDGVETVVNDAGPELKPGAPRSYVVRRGDTLWGLAQMFLRDPWLWPEIWFVNPQVQNPHRIYPGDTLQLAAGRDGRTALQLTRGPAARLQPLLRSTPLGDDGPIPTIPYEAIRAFLSKPGIIAEKDAKAAPYILGVRDGHIMAGTDDDIYLRQFKGAVGERYNVMHIGEPLRDPDGGDRLGYMALYAGAALVKRAGADATSTVTEVAREVLPGDILVNAAAEDLSNIVPHVPARPVTGRVIAITNGVSLAGQFHVVALNRGTRHGIDVGNVLRAQEATQSTRDSCVHIDGKATCRSLRETPLPVEDAGTLLVFRSFDRMSYALVVSESSPIRVGDRVRNP